MPSGALIRFLGGALPVRPKQHEERQRRGRHQAAAPPGHGGGAPAKEPAGAENAGGEAAPGEQPEAARLPRAMGVAALLSGARQWGFLWKALTVHSANLAAQLAARPLQPLQASRACAALAGACRLCRLAGAHVACMYRQAEAFMLQGCAAALGLMPVGRLTCAPCCSTWRPAGPAAARAGQHRGRARGVPPAAGAAGSSL